ncbi:TetR/AcrR family transcriptional regulator [Solirubrobacter deserti]|uniref:TetR/AcrR family transcriptional regulator n=1 Tax=Solirubrobacter deserti TaxID=2282478 RepID=A0ABT4REY5_9ACTN|nr:TetR/AcrR family transcriptional regulator [Solirubrobacter deserti]MDA0137111.1 TetR/AcrR family transcriptional regulator [Solirubrobacter deserti]
MTEPGDPIRGLELLWRVHTTPKRGPKQRLDLDQIVSAAIAVADEEGLDALSMRRVAERLKVGTMSLYTYVPGKPELLDLMLDAAIEPSTPHDVAHWRARLERVARENWDRFHRHPWLLEITPTRPVLGPNTIARYDHELLALDGIGLSDVEMDSTLTLLNAHTESAARRALEAARAEQRTGMTDEQWWAARAPFLERVIQPGRFPTASRVGTAAGEAHNAAYAPEHAFTFGLQRVLDGVDFLIRNRASDG